MFIVSLQEIIVVISFGRCRIANPREAGAEKIKTFFDIRIYCSPGCRKAKTLFRWSRGSRRIKYERREKK